MTARAIAACFALISLLVAAPACSALPHLPPAATTTPQPEMEPRIPLPVEITLPPGFRIHYYAQSVPEARSLAFSQDASGRVIVYVGTRAAGKVYAVLDHDQDNVADEVITIAEGLKMPNGVAYHDGALYVAEVSRILRFDDIENRLDDPPAPVVVFDGYPRDEWHGWKYLRIGPDGYLYAPVGVPCNVCETGDTLHGTITRLALDGSTLEVVARGVRNSVGFDWDPQTQELWFTDNGRDDLGDDLPPDELNHAPWEAASSALHFGFPYCHAGTIPDPAFGDLRGCDEFIPPAMPLGPHVAALGMRFYTGDLFPAEYRNQVFVAEHGSWNRTEPIGYRISLVRFDEGRPVSYEVFASGWLREGERFGRPVDVLQMPDGSLLVSDDAAGAIYRITYE